MRAGFNQQTFQPEQWRFASRTVDEFLEHVGKLNTEIGKENYNGLVTLALAGCKYLNQIFILEFKQNYA
jgi:hypothetical protein